MSPATESTAMPEGGSWLLGQVCSGGPDRLTWWARALALSPLAVRSSCPCPQACCPDLVVASMGSDLVHQVGRVMGRMMNSFLEIHYSSTFCCLCSSTSAYHA